MHNTRKQRMTAVAAAVTLLSAMVLPGGMTALAAENPLPPSACGQQAERRQQTRCRQVRCQQTHRQRTSRLPQKW